MDKWCRGFLFRNIKFLAWIYLGGIALFVTGGLVGKYVEFFDGFYGIEIVGVIVFTVFVAVNFLQNILFLKINNISRREILKGYSQYIVFLVGINLLVTLIFKWFFGYLSIFERVVNRSGFENIIYIILITTLSILSACILIYLAYRESKSKFGVISYIIGIFLIQKIMEKFIVNGWINSENILLYLIGGTVISILIFILGIEKFKVEGGYEV